MQTRLILSVSIELCLPPQRCRLSLRFYQEGSTAKRLRHRPRSSVKLLPDDLVCGCIIMHLILHVALP